MATKHFCDCCNKEISNGYGDDIYKLEIRTVPSNTLKEWMNELCKSCVKKIMSVVSEKHLSK
jgi:hypothetical protein